MNIFQTPSEMAMHCNINYAAKQTGQIQTAQLEGDAFHSAYLSLVHGF